MTTVRVSPEDTRPGWFTRLKRALDPRRRIVQVTTIATLALAGWGTTQTMMNPCLDVQKAEPAIMERGLMRLQFAGTPERAQAVITDYKAHCAVPQTNSVTPPTVASATATTGLEPAFHNLKWDFLFILLYGGGLGFLAWIVMRAMRSSLLRLLGAAAIAMVLIAMLLDFLENIGLWNMLSGSTSSWLPMITRLLASGKVGLLLAVFLYLAVAALALLKQSVAPSLHTYSGETALELAQTEAAAAARLDTAWSEERWEDTKKAVQPAPREEPPLPGSTGPAAKLNEVLAAELAYLGRHRQQSTDDSIMRMDRTLVGLSMSGGGIRSATTNLGILQALAELKILPFVDYLSTVSGGGYIGSCLTSLLSLNGSYVRAPHAESPPDQYRFKPNEEPAFTTQWENFPFRSDFVAPAARKASHLLAHLRTHGNFLIARRGLFKRDAMRAMGNLLTGIAYNVVGFLALLVTAAALYLWAVNSLVPGASDWLGPLASDSAYSMPKVRPVPPTVTNVSSTMVQTVSCQPPAKDCVVKHSSSQEMPSLTTWLWRNIKRVCDPVRAAIRDDGAHGALLRSVFVVALVAGVFLTLAGLFAIYVSRKLFEEAELPDPVPGESEDEAFDKALIRMLGLLAGVWVVMTTLVLQFWLNESLSQLALLWVPLIVLLAARLSNVVVAVVWPSIDPPDQPSTLTWSREVRSIWGANQAITIYGMWFAAGFLLLAPLIYAFAGNRVGASIGGLTALVLARYLTPARTGGVQRKLALPKGLWHALLAVAVLLVILFGMVAFGAMLVTLPTNENLLLTGAVGLAILAATGIFIDHNKLSPHYFYRDRLAETYLLSELPDVNRRHWTFRNAIELPLRSLHGDFTTASGRNPSPYHLISCAINLAGSRDLTRKDRKSGYFLFSKLYCGSTHTGFRPTAVYRRGETKLARAIAISGAAASSAIGFGTFFAQAFATVLFNVRLGYWLENPALGRSERGEERNVFWPWYLWREVTMNTTEHTRLVNLSDGGHTGDNVGIYPLFQRHCKIIIACDAEQDGALTFGSFTEVLRHAYVDMGISVDIDLSQIRPDPTTRRSRNHCAIGRIHYPDRPDQRSYLIYIKNSITGDEQEPVLNYQTACPDFPHETTADQFFDDAQFESYRALGVHMAKSTFAAWAGSPAFQFPEQLHSPWSTSP